MRSNTFRSLALACCLLLFTGCVRESTSGAFHVFAFQWWLSTAAFLAGAALIVGGSRALLSGWKHYDSKARSKLVLFIIFGLMIALGLAPSTFFYRIVVDPNGFSIRTGVLGTSFQEIKFNNLSRMELLTTRSSGRRGFSQTNYSLKCDGKSGSSHTIPLHYAVWSSVAKAALPLIEKNARSRGVVVIDGR